MIFLIRGRDKDYIEKRRKQTEEKHSKMKRKKNKECRESQITTINVFGSTFYVKNYILLKNMVWKSSLYHHILFTVFMGSRAFETQ